MSLYKTGIFLGLVGFSISCGVHSKTPVCPLKITTKQHLTENYAGWKPFPKDATHFMEGVSFYRGDPQEQAMLKPDSSTKGTATWTFSPDDSIYMVCDYNQTMIHLSQILPTNTTTCQVSYDQSINGANGPIPTEVVCH